MRVTQVTVGYSRTVGLPNYGSARFAVEYSAELDPGESAQDATRALHVAAREEVRRQALPLVRRAHARLDEVIQHLPEDIQRQIWQIVEQEGQR